MQPHTPEMGRVQRQSPVVLVGGSVRQYVLKQDTRMVEMEKELARIRQEASGAASQHELEALSLWTEKEALERKIPKLEEEKGELQSMRDKMAKTMSAQMEALDRERAERIRLEAELARVQQEHGEAHAEKEAEKRLRAEAEQMVHREREDGVETRDRMARDHADEKERMAESHAEHSERHQRYATEKLTSALEQAHIGHQGEVSKYTADLTDAVQEIASGRGRIQALEAELQKLKNQRKEDVELIKYYKTRGDHWQERYTDLTKKGDIGARVVHVDLKSFLRQESGKGPVWRSRQG